MRMLKLPKRSPLGAQHASNGLLLLLHRSRSPLSFRRGQAAFLPAAAACHTASAKAHCSSLTRLQLEDHKVIYEHLGAAELLRVLIVLRLCSLPYFVRHADALLSDGTRAGAGGSTSIGAAAADTPTATATTSADRRLLRGLRGWLRGLLFRHFCIGHVASDVWSRMNRLRANGVAPILDFAEEEDATTGLPLHCSPATAAVAAVRSHVVSGGDGGGGGGDGFTAVLGSATCRRKLPPPTTTPRAEAPEPPEFAACPPGTGTWDERRFRGFLASIDTAATLPGQNFAAVKLSALATRPATAIEGASPGRGGAGFGGAGGSGAAGAAELLQYASAAMATVMTALRRRDVAIVSGASASPEHHRLEAATHAGIDECLRRWGMEPPPPPPPPPHPPAGLSGEPLPALDAGGGYGGGIQRAEEVNGADSGYEGWTRHQDLRRLVAAAADLDLDLDPELLPYRQEGDVSLAKGGMQASAVGGRVQELDPSPLSPEPPWQQQQLLRLRRQQQIRRVEQVQEQLDQLLVRLEVLAERAASKGVKLIIDAELSSMRPALEHIAHGLMRRYNTTRRHHPHRTAAGGGADVAAVFAAARPEDVVQPQPMPDEDGGERSASGDADADSSGGAGGGEALVFLTYQSYFTDTGSRLVADLERAQREGYTLGINLVSGAYMHLERRWTEPPPPQPPVQLPVQPPSQLPTTSAIVSSRTGTATPSGAGLKAVLPPPSLYDSADAVHAAFGSCLEPLLGAVRAGRAEVMLGTHHRGCVAAAAALMTRLGLQPAEAPVYFGQLLGMADDLSFSLGHHGYRVYKLCPFGCPAKMVPYLARRVQEMQYALQVRRDEVRLAQAELVRRLLYGTAAAAGAMATLAAAKAAALVAAVSGDRAGSRGDGDGGGGATQRPPAH